MAATAFTLYNKAKVHLLNGTIDLDTNAIKARLYKTASNCSTATLSTFASISTQVTGGGYSNGKALASLSVVASGANAKFDAADLIFTAVGSNMVSIKFLALGVSGGKCICWSRLTTAGFTLAAGNTLTVQFNAAGIFVLS